jgi:arabinofuranosyltransferase
MWILYIFIFGGGFMEFRFFVPVMPLVMIVVMSTVLQFEKRSVQSLLIGVVLVGSAHHAITFDHWSDFGIESTSRLNSRLENRDQDWDGIGRTLNKMFAESGVVIATTAAGAVPYYSELETVDMFGINDRWVAENGYETKSKKPGHSRLAPLDYLISEGVNLLIGHPQLLPDTRRSVEGYPDLELRNLIPEREWMEIPSSARFIEIPMDDVYSLLVIYLTPHPIIEQMIAQDDLNYWPVVPSFAPSARS